MQICVTSTSRMSYPFDLFTKILKVTLVGVVAVAIAAAYLLSFIVSVLTLYDIR